LQRLPKWRLIVPRIHHRKLPDHSTLLSGSRPPDTLAFRSDHLQIWFNRTDETWRDPAPHFHIESDEIFIVLKGALIVDVDGERLRVEADELCAFPAGVVHSVVAVEPPVESLMIRAPSVSDKVYPERE
jgi:mannose-6-phosphate isomerase-like protein (cupin superfamily)